jgi:hypothetical protein
MTTVSPKHSAKVGIVKGVVKLEISLSACTRVWIVWINPSNTIIIKNTHLLVIAVSPY